MDLRQETIESARGGTEPVCFETGRKLLREVLQSSMLPNRSPDSDPSGSFFFG